MRTSELILQEVKKAVIGKDELLEKILMAILANGHILMEDMPGVGKTTIARAFADAMHLDCRRMQFTIDVLPADVTGFSVIDPETGKTRIRKGAVFTNLFLADEINRTSSRTQAALLEVMEEGSVSVDGVTMKLEQSFLVIATQNPYGSAGTQQLPESQLDRFMIRLEIGYPSEQDEIEILKRKQKPESYTVQRVAQRTQILEMQKACREVFVHDSLYHYIIQLLQATRNNRRIYRGASPRAGVSLMDMSKACAFMHGRDYVVPQDIQQVFIDTIAHRMLMQPTHTADAAAAGEALQEILQQIQPPHTRRKGL